MKTIWWKVLLLTALACTEKPGSSSGVEAVRLPKLDKANWLLGVWQAQSEKSTQYEIWKKSNDTVFIAESFFVRGVDTVSLERVELVEERDEVNYIPTVKNQNGGLPVPFKLIFMSETKLVFENQQHDFPQTITYEKIADDSLQAEISGIIDGVHRARQFPMKRQN
jgi:hypothetical protein